MTDRQARILDEWLKAAEPYISDAKPGKQEARNVACSHNPPRFFRSMRHTAHDGDQLSRGYSRRPG